VYVYISLCYIFYSVLYCMIKENEDCGAHAMVSVDSARQHIREDSNGERAWKPAN
jgi:hypothetical protein